MKDLIKTGQTAIVQTDAEENQQYLIFKQTDELFAIGTHTVKEIIEYGNLTSIPMMPNSIRGVINLRGAVVPVIDLAARFGGNQTKLTRRTCIVILDVNTDDGSQILGIIVDAVNEVVELPSENIEPSPSFGAKIRADFIEGIGKIDDKFIILLNINKVLSVDELSMLTAVAERSSGLGLKTEATGTID